jgi:hypothetical protein
MLSGQLLKYRDSTRHGVKTRYCLIYKRICQEHFSPSAGCAGLFRDIQPLSPWKTLVWCGRHLGLFHRSSCIFFSSDDADQFRNAIKPSGCMVAVGSEEARCRASLRPPLKLYVPVSGIQLSRKTLVNGRGNRARVSER